MRNSTATPLQLPTGEGLDGRVFTLSPTGAFLLYTRVLTETGQFQNSLWVIATERDAQPRSLEVEDVLWAGWNPASEQPLIAFTTAVPSAQPPGWEASNDLWLGFIPLAADQPFAPRRLIDSYPATYGWWGGNYSWSPTGSSLAYSYADEIGLIDTRLNQGELPEAGTLVHRPVHKFTEYRTRADWVWVPSLGWSPDGRFLTFSRHAGDNPDTADFELWIMDVETETTAALRPQAGIWSHTVWSPTHATLPEQQIAFLQATDILDTQRSSYTLWLMGQDGSNGRQLYPPQGENSFFSPDATALAWSPDGQAIAFIFHEALYLLNQAEDQVFRVTQDESRNSHLSWAPYGGEVSGSQ
jgi:hypothetical protein